jgi:DNA-binding transcriptional ArsR family regulator
VKVLLALKTCIEYSELSRIVGAKPSTLYNVLYRLRKRGLIEKRVVGKKVYVCATEEFKRLYGLA